MGSIPASKCSCGRVVAPATKYCPACSRPMEPHTLSDHGRLITYTILHAPPTGFTAPLPIALVELEGGVKFLCHGQGADPPKIGRSVRIEHVDNIYYFSTLSLTERAQLFWRRRGQAPAKVRAIVRSLFRRPRPPE